MIDIKLLRENPEKIKEAAKHKNIDVDIDRIIELDKKARELSTEVQKIQEERNTLNEKIKKDPNGWDKEGAQSLKQKLEIKEKELQIVKEELHERLFFVPNVPHPSVPVGKDESENVEIRKWGKPKEFSFPVKDHIELGKIIDGIDVEKAAQISGARFNYLKGDVALLEFALIQFAFSVLTSTEILRTLAEKIEKEYSAKPFIPVIPPVMIRPEVYKKMARIDSFDPKQEEEKYYLPKDNVFLIGSAEHTLGPLHMDETLPEKELPIRYVGFSTAFRREAGSYGKDTKGILRVHQFDKIEMETFTTPENSVKEQDFIVSIQEYFMQQLDIPYRVMMICTGDMAAPDARQIDIESWIPSQNKYRETHTSDLMTDYQSRRLNTKVQRKDNIKEFVHMNDATAFAIGRTLIAILENYQQEDGSVIIPKILQKYLGKEKITAKPSL